MGDERRQVLEMLAAGKINAGEAERLLAALEGNAAKRSCWIGGGRCEWSNAGDENEAEVSAGSGGGR